MYSQQEIQQRIHQKLALWSERWRNTHAYAQLRCGCHILLIRRDAKSPWNLWTLEYSRYKTLALAKRRGSYEYRREKLEEIKRMHAYIQTWGLDMFVNKYEPGGHNDGE